MVGPSKKSAKWKTAYPTSRPNQHASTKRRHRSRTRREAGRGFAVVADAVKGLSGESKQAAGSSINLVKTIKEAVNQTSTISNQSQLGAEEGAQVVLGAIKESEGIAKIMETMNNKVGGLTTGVEKGLQEIIAVTRTIEEVASIAEESSSASEEQSSAVEEQTASAQQMAGIAKEVTSVAENVETATKRVAESAGEVAKLAESVGNDAKAVENSANQIATHTEEMASFSRDVMEKALAVIAGAEKTNDQMKNLIQSRTNILNSIAKKYNIQLQ
jgi:methyl-accepting chemotaxis protein